MSIVGAAGCPAVPSPTSTNPDFLTAYNIIVALHNDAEDAYRLVTDANIDVTGDATHNSVIGDLQNFANCTDGNGNDTCKPDVFTAVRQALLARLWADSNVEVNPDGLQSQLQQAQGLLAKLPVGIDDAWIQNAAAALKCARERIYRAQQIASVTKATLQPLLNELTNLQPPDVYQPPAGGDKYFLPDTYLLPSYEKTKVVAAITCTNQLTNRVLPQISVEIDYQDQGPISASGGIIVSMLGQHQVGIRTKNVPNGSNPFTTYFAVTNHSSQQFIPFSLLNVLLTGSMRTNLNFSGGIGINPYNGPTQVEYFLGFNMTIKKVALLGGVHIGRFQNLGGGFQIGQAVPNGWTSSTPVPTDSSYTAHLGVGIAYTIP